AAARDRMGRHRAGHAEGARELSDGHDGVVSHRPRGDGSGLRQRARQPGSATSVNTLRVTDSNDGRGAALVRAARASLTRLGPRSIALAALIALIFSSAARAEDGYELWLRYHRIDDAALLRTYQSSITSLIVPGQSATARITATELSRGLGGLLDAKLPDR